MLLNSYSAITDDFYSTDDFESEPYGPVTYEEFLSTSTSTLATTISTLPDTNNEVAQVYTLTKTIACLNHNEKLFYKGKSEQNTTLVLSTKAKKLKLPTAEWVDSKSKSIIAEYTVSNSSLVDIFLEFECRITGKRPLTPSAHHRFRSSVRAEKNSKRQSRKSSTFS